MDDRRDKDINFELIHDEEKEDQIRPNDNSNYQAYGASDDRRKRGFRGSLISYVAIALVASILGGLVATFVGPSLLDNLGITTASKEYQTQPINIQTTDDLNTVSAVVKKAMPSVVGITTLETQQSIFGSLDREGLGSGVIVDRDGYILTNSHVIANGKAKKITVLFDNGEQAPGEVLWNDATLDLAIVKVDMTNLPVAELGDSDSLEVGELAIAIGNPLGLEFQRTVTSGIISGLNRSIKMDQTNVMEDLIQTDASINSGNSGGPLLNSKGQVIGINTAKIKSAEGLGFAIPINVAKVIIEEVINQGSFDSVVMGVTILDIKEYQARLGINLGIEDGVIILEVGENSAAAKAGLVPGDIIIKMDDVEIATTNKLKRQLYKYKVGDRVSLTILRNNEEMQLDLEFIENK
ncbi:MAG: trypsin-like peptidase domain-containing protein [Tissierellaceae bacterium]|jgi:serine protease Do|nr:PDZ domain-containing protein [Tissierellia bacterium]